MDVTNVFVSHSSEDARAVMSLVGDLQRAGTQVWLDDQLKGGDAWWPSILDKIRTCTVFVFALSENSLNSEPCQAELHYAMDLGLPILPVQLGEVRSYRIDTIFTWQIIDHRNPTASSAAALFGAIAELRNYRRALPDPLPTPPPVPYEYLRRLGAEVNGPNPLPYPKQVDILNQLREKYRQERDPKAHADVRQLLETLRHRPETAQSAAEDIDALLQSANRNTAPQKLLLSPGSHRRNRLVWVAGAVFLLAMIVGGAIGGYFLLRPTPVDLQVARSADDYGIVVGAPHATKKIELFIEPQCKHCATFDVDYGHEIAERIEDGALQVTYRPVTFNDEPMGNDYSSRVANALFLASSAGAGTSPDAFAGFLALLWNPPGDELPDDSGMAAMAERSGIPPSVINRIRKGDIVVQAAALNDANLRELEEKAPNSQIPVVFDGVAESAVDYDNPDWLDRLKVSADPAR